MSLYDREPLYVISVAARLLEMHAQTLRKYERAGLLRPARRGNQRLYSDADVRRLRRIRYLVEDRGLNVAGLEMTLAIVDRLDAITTGTDAPEMRAVVTEVVALTEEGTR